MRAILISPNYTMEEIDMENSLEALQKAVEGRIENVTLITDLAAMIVNEEGLLLGMKRNVIASIIAGTEIVGPALIVGISNEEYCDVPDEVKRFIRVRYGGGAIK
jgi:hypothetical protein